MHASFNTFFTGYKLDEAAFRFNHIKIEATGEVNDRLFYWYRTFAHAIVTRLILRIRYSS
ncbi:hypothetical protein LEA_06175, partial [human gut metagenome]